MIIINDRFRVTRDSRNWILERVSRHKATRGKNEGKMVETIEETYYGSLQSLCRHCVDKSLDPDGGLKNMLEQLERVNDDLTRMIKKNSADAKRVIREAAK